MVRRGKLIVFEGLDRAGKSTQCSKLVEYLEAKGHRVRLQRFPDRTTVIGQMIDSYLKGNTEQEDHVIHLLFSANRWEAAAGIEADINAGITVVVDRYYYSGCVYTAAKGNPLLDLAWCRHPEVGLPRPDVCMFLDLTPEEAARRGAFGEEKYERKEMQNRVRELFKVMRESAEKDDFVTIDAGGSVEEVEALVAEAATRVVEEVDRKQLLLRRVDPW